MKKEIKTIIEKLTRLLDLTELNKIKNSVEKLFATIDDMDFKQVDSELDIVPIDKSYLLNELQQIIETKTIERTKYYIQRLIKGLTEIRTGKINDINLNQWKSYDDILTDSLWILDKRDNSGAHSAGYWGNFIPQIPNQFLRRFTKKGEWVLDPFVGSGTTLIEAKRLGRNGIGIDVQKKAIELTKENLKKDSSKNQVNIKLIEADSIKLDYKKILNEVGIQSVQLIILHPPYWDIIKFSDNKNDLSNAKSIDEFLKLIGKLIDRTFSILDKGRYLAIVISDKYENGEWIPLGFYTMQEIMKRGYKLKSTIVKNFEDTTAKRNQKSLWKYRSLVGGFYIFKHEYIFLFQKK
ncbi:MAG: DNA methyltransferase [Candidatus Marinimicrobia bacterium]|nr:DNA methyltransferase [Candidatus Neomarinimicrobiota bacterium]